MIVSQNPVLSPERNPLPAYFDKEGPRGLVLGGGGSKGCYHVGLWQAFKELGLSFDGVTGSSIGALVGLFYAQEDILPVTRFVMNMTPTQIAKELPYMPTNVKETLKSSKTMVEFLWKYMDDKMDITPLKENFDEMFDYEAFKNSKIAYGCMTNNETLQQGQAFVKEDFTPENARDILMASSACYPAFPKVEMNGQVYTDGGYADNVPIDLLKTILPDWKTMVVVDLHGPQEEPPASLDENIFYIQPLLYPGRSLDFSRDHALSLYNQGYLEARKYLDQNPGYLYTFGKEDWDVMQVVETYLEQLMEQKQILLPHSDMVEMECLEQVLGYRPYPLHNRFNEKYHYGKLVEALGLLSKINPVGLYSYREFLKTMVQNLNNLKLTNTEESDFKMVEMLSNLKREELTVRLHRILVKNNGTFPSAVEAFKNRVPGAYTLAYVWYFIEELVRNLEP